MDTTRSFDNNKSCSSKLKEEFTDTMRSYLTTVDSPVVAVETGVHGYNEIVFNNS